MFKYEII